MVFPRKITDNFLCNIKLAVEKHPFFPICRDTSEEKMHGKWTFGRIDFFFVNDILDR